MNKTRSFNTFDGTVLQKEHYGRRKVIVRCRKCWKDVSIQRGTDPVLPCSICGQPETYVHAIISGPVNVNPDRLEGSDGADRPGQA